MFRNAAPVEHASARRQSRPPTPLCSRFTRIKRAFSIRNARRRSQLFGTIAVTRRDLFGPASNGAKKLPTRFGRGEPPTGLATRSLLLKGDRESVNGVPRCPRFCLARFRR